MNNVIAQKYRLIRKMGQGQFGSVCEAQSVSGPKKYAVKLESMEVPHSILKHEATILFYLNSQKCSRIPFIYHYAPQSNYTCLVMSFYEGGSLTSLKKSMRLDDKIRWWNSSLNTLAKIHKAGIVHRDIKPDHFMRDGRKQWNLIDFGLATTFYKDGLHIDQMAKVSIVGTPNYVSHYVHEGWDAVRRDDFLSLIYVFLELLFDNYLGQYESAASPPPGTYPLTHIAHPYNQWLYGQKQFKRLYEWIQEKEIVREGLPDALISILFHAEHLAFQDTPNYKLYVIELEDSHLSSC